MYKHPKEEATILFKNICKVLFDSRGKYPYLKLKICRPEPHYNNFYLFHLIYTKRKI